jgi:outer membrane scaffolding protein for murein synthesis (MipA/OmpV family)
MLVLRLSFFNASNFKLSIDSKGADVLKRSFKISWVESVVILASSSALISNAMAQAPSAAPLWELGGVAFGVSQQAYPGSDQHVSRVLPLPLLVYRGEMLRADRETAGIRALKTQNFEIDIGVAGSFGAGSGSIDARKGMPELGTLVELGPRLKWKLGAAPANGRWRAEIPLRGVFDLSNQVEHKGLSFEPKLIYERQSTSGWSYNASIGAIFADTKLAQTFYEVNSAQATALRPAYAATSGLVAWRLGSSFSRSLSRDLRLFGFARVDTVVGAANELSPLVRQTTGATVGMGVSYNWLRSEQRGQD